MHFEGVASRLTCFFVAVGSSLPRSIVVITIIKCFNKCCDFNKRMAKHLADVLAVDL